MGDTFDGEYGALDAGTAVVAVHAADGEDLLLAAGFGGCGAGFCGVAVVGVMVVGVVVISWAVVVMGMAMAEAVDKGIQQE